MNARVLRNTMTSLLLLTILCCGGCKMAHTRVMPASAPEQAAAGAVVTVAHIYANVYGYQLPLGIPIASGAADRVNQYGFSFFTNAVDTGTIATMILNDARELGATHVVDLQTHYLSGWIKWLGIVWQSEAEGSATAIRVQRGAAPPGAVAVPPVHEGGEG